MNPMSLYLILAPSQTHSPMTTQEQEIPLYAYIILLSRYSIINPMHMKMILEVNVTITGSGKSLATGQRRARDPCRPT
jgi:hypothetical protein